MVPVCPLSSQLRTKPVTRTRSPAEICSCPACAAVLAAAIALAAVAAPPASIASSTNSFITFCRSWSSSSSAASCCCSLCRSMLATREASSVCTMILPFDLIAAGSLSADNDVSSSLSSSPLSPSVGGSRPGDLLIRPPAFTVGPGLAGATEPMLDAFPASLASPPSSSSSSFETIISSSSSSSPIICDESARILLLFATLPLAVPPRCLLTSSVVSGLDIGDDPGVTAGTGSAETS